MERCSSASQGLGGTGGGAGVVACPMSSPETRASMLPSGLHAKGGLKDKGFMLTSVRAEK